MTLTVKQVASELGVCAKTIHRRVQSGELQAMKISPTLYLIEREDLEDYKARMKQRKPYTKKGE